MPANSGLRSRRGALVPAAPVILGAFVAFGIMWGAWAAALPDLVEAVGISSGELGLLLTLGFAAAFPIMFLAGRVIDRLGPTVALGLPAGGLIVAFAINATVPAVTLLAAGVVLMIASSGALDVGINAAAIADAAWRRPARMALLHAGFSGGGALGAIATGSLLATGIPFTFAYLGVAALLTALVVLVLLTRWPPVEPPPPAAGAMLRLLLPFAVLAGLSFLVEGTMETWTAIYLRTVLGATAFVGSLGPAVFHLAVMSGRLFGAALVGLIGPARTLLAGGTGMGVAIVLGLAAPAPLPAIVGFGLTALATSFIVPVVIGLAGERAGGQSGRVASYVLTLGYAGFLVGPSLIGLLAELAGLRVALLVVAVAGGAVAIGSRAVTRSADGSTSTRL